MLHPPRAWLSSWDAVGKNVQEEHEVISVMRILDLALGPEAAFLLWKNGAASSTLSLANAARTEFVIPSARLRGQGEGVPAT